MKHPEDYEDGLKGSNDKYDTRGTIGTYCTDPEPFRNPSDIKMFAGFGANESDLDLGYIKPDIKELPVFDKENYVDKWTQYRVSDADSNGGEDLPEDVRFRMKDRETKGLFVRPRIPTER